MAALLWLVFAFALGWCAMQPLARLLARSLETPSLFAPGRPLRPLIVLIPAALALGLFLSAWLTYTAAYALSSWIARPLGAANALFFVVGIAALYFSLRFRTPCPAPHAPLRRDLPVVFAALLFSLFLAFDSFSGSREALRVGASIAGDFNLHIATVRSFSLASNIPAEYVFVAGAPNRYHFLFYFLCGNLEYLGMPLVWAINFPSALGLWCALVMLWSFSVIFSGSRLAAGLTLVMFALRSSFSVWYFIAEKSGGGSWREALRQLWTTRAFHSSTNGESLGIYALNPFINQRHLGLSLAICYLLLLLLLPHLRQLSVRPLRRFAALPSAGDAVVWTVLGIMLGGLMLLNSALLLGMLCIFGVLLICSPQPMLFGLLCAAASVTGGLVNIMFLDGGAAAREVFFSPGYLADSAMPIDLARYYLKAFGLLPVMIAVSFAAVPRPAKYLLLALCAPCVIANLFQFTPAMYNNHKFFNLSVPLLNVFAALLLVRLVAGGAARKSLGILLVFLLTATGAADFIAMVRGNRVALVPEPNSVIAAVAAQTDAKAVFLHPLEAWRHPIASAGRKAFLSMPSTPQSIGYRLDEREAIANAILACADRDSVRRLPKEHAIAYLAFPWPCRFAEELYDRVPLPPDAGFALYRVR